MIATTFSQPETQLGTEFMKLLDADRAYRRIIFVSAFTSLRTILRLRERILSISDLGTTVRLVLGIDLGGTSRDVLKELLHWNCEVFIFYNPLVRATFHPKIYLFESESDSMLFIGSNNLTDGGLYTNYEACTCYEFRFPADEKLYKKSIQPIVSFIEPSGPTVCRLDDKLIDTLTALGILISEIDMRRSRRAKVGRPRLGKNDKSDNPFSSVMVPYPPLLQRDIRKKSFPHSSVKLPKIKTSSHRKLSRPKGILVWRKKLPQSDALQVSPGSNPVGGVRLTQAGFENPSGHTINHTTYFRSLFDDYDWESEGGRYADQEHTYISMRIFIRGKDYGIRNFEISHKPSGEAGQDNYTTIFRWGRSFSTIIKQSKLKGAIFSLYEASNSDTQFFIEITDS
jgi:hypothetical protein